MSRVLVVDAANVIGSVPDGWWRDRAGAARRLHTALVDAEAPTLDADTVVCVLEGAARPGVPAGTEGHVTTVHAPGEGDDEIVARIEALLAHGHAVTLASADRGLLARVPDAAVLGPRHLRARLGLAGGGAGAGRGGVR